MKNLIGYPPIAKDAEITGKVIVRILVDEDGNYVRHIVLKDPHPILTKSVTDHLSILKFRPAISEGKPVKFWVTMPFQICLRQ